MLELGRSLADSCSGDLNILSCWDYEFESFLRDSVWVKVSDAKEAKEAEPHIGDKSEVVFDQFVARAAERCEVNEFQHADQLLNIARGIVASE